MRFADAARRGTTPIRRRLGRVPTAWSVGLVGGPSLDRLEVSEPVLSPGFAPVEHLSLVADPFFVAADGCVHLYVEAVVAPGGRGEIHHAVLDRSGVHYAGPALAEDVHMSFPYVFLDPTSGRYCMIPETSEALEVRLYVADAPAGPWSLERVLLSGRPFVDTVAFRRADRWYLVTESSGGASDRREVHAAPSLDGAFTPVAEHRLDPARCRLAGRVVDVGADVGADGADGADDHVRLVTQDCAEQYGHRVSVERVGPWSASGPPHRFAGEAAPLIGPDPARWFHSKVHGVDLRVGPSGVVGVVDGRGRQTRRPVLGDERIASFVAAATAAAGIDLP